MAIKPYPGNADSDIFRRSQNAPHTTDTAAAVTRMRKCVCKDTSTLGRENLSPRSNANRTPCERSSHSICAIAAYSLQQWESPALCTCTRGDAELAAHNRHDEGEQLCCTTHLHQSKAALHYWLPHRLFHKYVHAHICNEGIQTSTH